MKNFFQLCRFEQKKLLQKGYVRIILLVMVAVTLFLNVRPLLEKHQVAYLDDNDQVVMEELSYYQEVQLERKFAEPYNGKLLTDEMIEEARELNAAHRSETSIAEDGYIPLMNVRLIHRSVYNLGVNPDCEVDHPADFTYQQMMEDQDERCNADSKDYWQEKRSGLKIPMTMYYAKGYQRILATVQWPCIMALCFTVLCLCTAFSEETACRMDPLMRTTRYGTMKVSVAKLVAGESVAVMTVLLLFGITTAIQLFVHGAGGAGAPIQMQDTIWEYPFYARMDALTVGGAVLIVLGIALLLVLCMGAFTMLLSKLFRRTVPALVVPAAVMFLSLTISRKAGPYWVDKALALKHHMMSYFPIQRLEIEALLVDDRLVRLFGIPLNAMEMSVILYGGLTLLFLLLCMIACKATVKSRN